MPVAPLGGVDARHVRAPWSLPSFAFFCTVCLVLVPVIDPTAAFAIVNARVTAPGVTEGPQTVTADQGVAPAIDRSPFSISKYHATAPRAAAPTAGSAQAIAHAMVIARGWDEGQFSCLVALWNRESNWNVYATNKSSGAYGIPQALPGNKMATAGADWETSARTQITWGLGYIAERYKNPCGAWTSSETRGWY
jgi:hypothetical protein